MTVRFGPYQFDRSSAELWKEGKKLRLQGQPLRVLDALIEQAGAVVSREALRRQLWSEDTFVDFDNSLNNAINRLRTALEDDAASPRYVETVGRRGYRFIATVGSEPERGSTPAAGVASPRLRLAVLPFRMLRGSADFEFLASSLPDAVAASLWSLESLAVRSPLAAARFAAPVLDLPSIASALDVDLVLAGTIQQGEGRIRIATQLIEAPGGRLLWTHTAEQTLEDLFRLQDELATRIVESLSLPLSGREHHLLHHDVPANGEAFESYLRANQASEKPATWLEARDLYLKAIGLDPHYAPAWARLGRIYRLMAKYGAGEANASAALAEEAFRQALALNPDLALAHHLYAQLQTESGRMSQALVRLIERARVHPSDPQLFAGLVHACRYGGLLQESLQAHAKARALDPNVASSVAHTWRALGQWEEALAASDTDVVFRAEILLTLGRYEEARAAAEIERLALSHPIRAMWFEVIQGLLTARPEMVCARVDDILRSDFRDPEGYYNTAAAAMRAGNPQRALRALHRASETGFASLPQLDGDPLLSPLAGDPEFARIRSEVAQRHTEVVQAFEEAGGRTVLSGHWPS